MISVKEKIKYFCGYSKMVEIKKMTESIILREICINFTQQLYQKI